MIRRLRPAAERTPRSESARARTTATRARLLLGKVASLPAACTRARRFGDLKFSRFHHNMACLIGDRSPFLVLLPSQSSQCFRGRHGFGVALPVYELM